MHGCMQAWWRTFHLSTFQIFIFGMLHPKRNYNAPWLLIIKTSFLLYLWRFFKVLSKQVTRRVDNFVLKLITNYDLTGNPRRLRYKIFIKCWWIFRKPWHECKHLLIYIVFKWFVCFIDSKEVSMEKKYSNLQIIDQTAF